MSDYKNRHQYLRRRRGKATDAGPCADCGGLAAQWSQIHGTAGLDLWSDYVPRCRDCHHKYDRVLKVGTLSARLLEVLGEGGTFTSLALADSAGVGQDRSVQHRQARVNSALARLRACGLARLAGWGPGRRTRGYPFLWEITPAGREWLATPPPMTRADCEAIARQDRLERRERAEKALASVKSVSRLVTPTKRYEVMSMLRAEGCSLDQIGEVYGVTRERARQILRAPKPVPKPPRKPREPLSVRLKPAREFPWAAWTPPSLSPLGQAQAGEARQPPVAARHAGHVGHVALMRALALEPPPPPWTFTTEDIEGRIGLMLAADLEVECPHCSAPVGAPCLGARGQVLTWTHGRRRRRREWLHAMGKTEATAAGS